MCCDVTVGRGRVLYKVLCMFGGGGEDEGDLVHKAFGTDNVLFLKKTSELHM